MAQVELDKGGKAEELLRKYFLEMGYFVVRGIKVSFRGTEVSDLDLWLYNSISPISKVRINVDSRRSGTPKALERILWAKGLQTVLRLEQCIVATTDKRPLVREYGEKHNVQVLDGNFFGELVQEQDAGVTRFTEEEFVGLFTASAQDKLIGDWKGRLLSAKSRLITQLNFDGCNAWLEDSKYFIEQTLVSSRSEPACRLVYLIVSFFLIGLDYSLLGLLSEKKSAKRQALEDGLRYGARGKVRTEDRLRSASDLISNYTPEKGSLGQRIRTQVFSGLSKIPVDVLATYFIRKEVCNSLLVSARDFESKAFERVFLPPKLLDARLQSVLGVILDFHKIDREKFFSRI